MSKIDELYPVSKSEYESAGQILANAFSKKPIHKKLNTPIEDIRNMLKTPTRFALRYGKIYATSAALEGILIILPEKYSIKTNWQLIRSGAIFPALKINKRLKQVLIEVDNIIDEDKKNFTIGPYIYCYIIGVSPAHQGKGFGGKLLEALIEKADTEKKAIYLETDTEENVSLYEHFGFKVIKEIKMPGLDLPMWEMVRAPSSG